MSLLCRAVLSEAHLSSYLVTVLPARSVSHVLREEEDDLARAPDLVLVLKERTNDRVSRLGDMHTHVPTSFLTPPASKRTASF